MDEILNTLQYTKVFRKINQKKANDVELLNNNLIQANTLPIKPPDYKDIKKEDQKYH